jgi:MFS family permease
MEVAQVTPQFKKGRGQLAAIVVLGHALKHIYMAGLQTILLPEIKISLGLSATQLGALAFSRQATGWATTMGAGYLGDRFPHRASTLLGISLAMMGVSYFFAGISTAYWVMFAAMLLVGVGPALYHPPALGALSRRFPDRRGFATALHGTGGTVGETLGPLTVAGLLVLLTWRGVLQLSLAPALLGAFLIWKTMRSGPPVAPMSLPIRAYLVSLAVLLKRRDLFILVLATALRSAGQHGVLIFLPVYLREDLGFTPTKVAVYLSLSQVVGIGAQPAMGYLSDKLGRKVVLLPAMTALGLLFFALRLAEPGAQLILTIVALGAFLYSLHEISIAAAMDTAGGEVQSTMASLIYGASFLGAFSPIIAGAIVDATGTTANAFTYGGAVVLAGVPVLLLLRLPKTADQTARARH